MARYIISLELTLLFLLTYYFVAEILLAGNFGLLGFIAAFWFVVICTMYVYVTIKGVK